MFQSFVKSNKWQAKKALKIYEALRNEIRWNQPVSLIEENAFPGLTLVT